MKVLIVEDELKTGDYLRQGLAEAGFVADLARNGTDGLHLALTGDYDLLVLDVMLPGLNGWQLLQTLRRGGHALPVLFLTARDQVEDRVKGLELGADDYLVKPFAFSEFLARVRTLLRRGKGNIEPTVLRIADLELDLMRRRAQRGGHRTHHEENSHSAGGRWRSFVCSQHQHIQPHAANAARGRSERFFSHS